MKVNKFNAGMALGSLTAVVALLASGPVARADDSTLSVSNTSDSGQAAPGGGSFPGSFLVPGTNTSIKIGGLAKEVFIYDASTLDSGSVDPDVVAPFAIPLEGTALHQEHGGTRLQARQSNFFFDVRTPTSYGEVDTFILLDFFGQNTAQAQSQANTQNARLVLAYGTLGPLLAGQTLSNFFDGDAIGETVDPTTSVGGMNGLTNRQPQFRYTYAGANGLSIAGSVEQPTWEDFDNSAAFSTATGIAAPTTASSAAAGWNRWPDFVGKVRLDQAWGHVQAAVAVRDQDVYAVGTPRVSATGWAGMLGAHWNAFGKDTLRFESVFGQAVGHFLSDMREQAGIQTNLATGAVKTPFAYGANISYTHWWTDELRSTAMAGYSHLQIEKGVITTVAAASQLDDHHIGATGNLIWSPVPQVDLGIEFDYIKRVTHHAFFGGNSNTGEMDRVEAMAAFKF